MTKGSTAVSTSITITRQSGLINLAPELTRGAQGYEMSFEHRIASATAAGVIIHMRKVD